MSSPGSRIRRAPALVATSGDQPTSMKVIVPPRQSVLGDQGGGLGRPPDMSATEARAQADDGSDIRSVGAPHYQLDRATVPESHYHT